MSVANAKHTVINPVRAFTIAITILKSLVPFSADM